MAERTKVALVPRIPGILDRDDVINVCRLLVAADARLLTPRTLEQDPFAQCSPSLRPVHGEGSSPSEIPFSFSFTRMDDALAVVRRLA